LKKLKQEKKDKELEALTTNKKHLQEIVALFLLEILAFKLLNQVYKKHSHNMEKYRESELLKIKMAIQEDLDTSILQLLKKVLLH
tara:strand:- start:153 stop:407 length:255 start_codon:yes stop_codon:yes gene_type:complete